SIPTIQAGNSTLIVGEAFDPYKGISAQDKEDGDLTDKIEVIANNVDTSKAGVYEVTYKVIDSQGASATKTVYVSVEGVEVTIDPELKAIITNPDIISEVSGFGTMENPLMVGVRSDVTVELVTEYVKQLNEAMKTSKKVVSQDGYVYYYLTLVNSKTRADGTIYVTIRINQEQTDVIRIVDQYFGLDNNQIIPPTENEGGSTDTSTPNEENGNSESQLNQLPNLGMQLAQLFIGIGAAILAISGVVLFFMRRK
ncbi:MAG: immunoglobulin-like domain-containing protein, partial [Culicoidibacterales bacterium]